MKTVVVIGAGITGLASMYELEKWKTENNSDVRLVLIEASEELGGKIKTMKEDCFLMETGADSIVVRKAKGMSFIEELELQDELVYNDTGISFIYSDGQLKPIPTDSVFGIPASVESLAKSTLVSAEGKVEALKDFYTKNESFTKDDSVGEFLEYFFGKELVEKQIAPVLSGVYSGNLMDLTISSTLPYLINYKADYGSIIKGLEANKKQFQSGGEKKFFSFQDGLSTLVSMFEKKLENVEIYKNTKVTRINKNNQSYQILLDSQEMIESDYVILSVPHTAAEKMLPDSQLGKEFSTLKTSSLISVYMGYKVSDELLPADGTGFITASSNDISCNACTWTSRKWKHTSSNGNLLVRLFYKSSHPAFDTLKDMGEEELLQVAQSDINKSLGIAAKPVVIEITKWMDSMPNYSIMHPATVKRIEDRLAEKFPGIMIAGCSYYGVGIPDCIENGGNTARKIIELL